MCMYLQTSAAPERAACTHAQALAVRICTHRMHCMNSSQLENKGKEGHLIYNIREVALSPEARQRLYCPGLPIRWRRQPGHMHPAAPIKLVAEPRCDYQDRHQMHIWLQVPNVLQLRLRRAPLVHPEQVRGNRQKRLWPHSISMLWLRPQKHIGIYGRVDASNQFVVSLPAACQARG